MILEDKLFLEACNLWDLQKLYTAIASTKEYLSGQKKLTSLEKAILRGLLCGYSLSEIARQFPDKPQGLIVNLSWKLHRCIESRLGEELREVNSYTDIPNWLEAAGYKQKLPLSKRQDYYSVPDLSVIYGRLGEQNLLKQWIQKERCRLVVIVGMVGIGKTTLAAKVVQDIHHEFDLVIWRSLRYAPPFEGLLAELLQFFANGQEYNLPENIYSSIAQLIKYLRAFRCLLILDDWQLVMKEEKEYDNYKKLLTTIAEVPHQSCLIINSSEKPYEIDFLVGDCFHCLQLKGLGESARAILQEQGLLEEHLWEKLITLYRGNPKELKLVATTIKNVFGRSVAAFFSQKTELGVIVHETSKQVLDRQFQRLSALECQIMQIIANHRQAISREHLQEALTTKVHASELTIALESLFRRSLIEITIEEGKQFFTLEPMVMKYVIREYLAVRVPRNSPMSVSQPQSKTVPKQPDSEPIEKQNQPQSSSLVPFPKQQPIHIVRFQHHSLPSVQANELLPPISRWTNLGGLFIVGSVAIAIALAAFTPYHVTVQAQAKVRPSGELRVIEAQTEGVVVDIRAQENQTVRKGDIVAILNDSRFQTRKSQLQSNIQQAKLQLLQINAQIEAQKRQILAETDRINLAVAISEQELSRTRREYQDRKITTTAQVEEASANLRVAQEELHQAEADWQSARANLKSTQAALDSAKSRQARYQTIAASGALSQNQLEEAQLAVVQQQEAVAAQQATVERHQKGIERQRQAVEAARARLENTRAALNPIDAEVAIARENIARERATGTATLASLQRDKEALIQQRIEIEKQIESDNSELQQVEKEIAQTAIAAPADGILFQLNLRNSGQTVKMGDKIAQIAPSQTGLAIEALVAAQDISKVKTEQPAQMRVSACPYPDYGTLKGSVTNISPDVISSQNNPSSANPSSQSTNASNDFYAVTIKPESLSLSQGQKKCLVQLGMEGRADIISREETVLQFLLRKARLIADL
jgi:multidrug efflux pump subunit AcrA (membrane-fusion protein)